MLGDTSIVPQLRSDNGWMVCADTGQHGSQRSHHSALLTPGTHPPAESIVDSSMQSSMTA
jgi:hypothetical protein